MQVIVPVVEPPLALFEVQAESRRRHTVELLETTLGIAPEALDAVDVALLIGKLVRAMMDSEVLGVTDINQAIVAAPAVRVDDGVGRDATANNGLQRGFFAVRHDLRVDLAVALQEAEDDSLMACTATALAAHAMRAEVRLVNFHLAAPERRLAFTLFGDTLTEFAKDRDNRTMRDARQLCCISGV